MMVSSGALTRRSRRLLQPAVAAVTVAVALSACDRMNQAMTAHTDVVARAAGAELRVEQAAEILASNPQAPADPEVVEAVADLWIDYSLLAHAVSEDPTLAALNMEAFAKPIREQEIVGRLREVVIQPDTIIDDAELEQAWATDGPGAEISARHILLRLPTNATDAQRDSVQSLAESLRQRAIAGESFEDLAREHSQDPGSASRGGDLGFFGRGRMVQPFEEAAFALEPGQISPVVETPYGYHVILVEDRRQPEMGDERESFRQYMVQRSIQDAETAYLDSLSAAANVKVLPEGLELLRDIAANPQRPLRGRQASRPLATYEGGEYTAGEFREFIRALPLSTQSAFASAPPEQVEPAVLQLVQMELLLAEAEERGIALSAEDEERILTDARGAINSLVVATGFADAVQQGIDPATLQVQVRSLLQGVVSGVQPYIPLGMLGISLRELYPHELNEAAFAEVVRRVEDIRAQQPAEILPQQIQPLPLDSAALAPEQQSQAPVPPSN